MREVHLLEIQNPYPDCALINLGAVPLPDSDSFQVLLTLSCHEKTLNLLAGRVKFTLRSARFKLMVKDSPFEPVWDVVNPAFQATLQTKTLTAPEQSFLWQFTPLPGQGSLKAVTHTIALGTLPSHPQPAHVTALLLVRPADLGITTAEGLWRHDLSPNKHALLDRVLAHFLCEHSLSPAVSWLQLSLGHLDHWDDLFPRRGKGVAPEIWKGLGDRLETMYESPLTDWADLCGLAGLDPKVDLAGGNFLGTNLSGEDFSQGQLCHCNFRGAILTDTDFSEADLRGANFSGADLSGVYLENAQLHQANFRKSSLALANLIGADLTGANLTEANLQQTNLSGAIVTSALFGDNPGMTPELQQSLRERGAKFLSHSPEEVLL